MINLYESIFKKKKVKLKKDNKQSFFLKSDTLGELKYDDIVNLVNIIVSWYKVRLPDDIFIKKDNAVNIDKKNINYQKYNKMSFQNLLEKNVDINLLKCNYGKYYPFDNNVLTVKIFTTKGNIIKKEDKVCNLFFDKTNGKILDFEGSYLLPRGLMKRYDDYSVEELLLLFKESHIESLDYSSLKKCVAKRKKDISTRNKIIDKVCYDLLLTDTKEVQYNCFRTFLFIKEINDFLDLDLGIEYLNNLFDKIIERKYNKKNDKLSKAKIKKLANHYSFIN